MNGSTVAGVGYAGGSVQGGPVPQSSTPKGQSEFGRESSRLASEVDYCYTKMSMLLERLSPVLSPVTPKADANIKNPSPSTDIARFLCAQSDKMKEINDAFDSVFARLEI